MIKILDGKQYRDYLTPEEFAKKINTLPVNLKDLRRQERNKNLSAKYKWLKVNGRIYYRDIERVFCEKCNGADVKEHVRDCPLKRRYFGRKLS